MPEKWGAEQSNQTHNAPYFHREGAVYVQFSPNKAAWKKFSILKCEDQKFSFLLENLQMRPGKCQFIFLKEHGKDSRVATYAGEWRWKKNEREKERERKMRGVTVDFKYPQERDLWKFARSSLKLRFLVPYPNNSVYIWVGLSMQWAWNCAWLRCGEGPNLEKEGLKKERWKCGKTVHNRQTEYTTRQ